MKKWFFVEFSKGEMEGTKYNNISLSNGMRTASLKNKTDIADEVFNDLVEGQEVIPTFDVKIVKGPNKTQLFGVELKALQFIDNNNKKSPVLADK